MSAEGFALLARMEAPSGDHYNNNQSDFYQKNGNGKITYVKNQDIEGKGDITVGYGLLVKKGSDGTALRNYLSSTHTIDASTRDAWVPANKVVTLLNDLSGTDVTPGTRVVDHGERTKTFAKSLGFQRLTQQQFDALTTLVVVGRWSNAARALFATDTTDEEAAQAIYAVYGAAYSGHLPRFRAAVAVIRHGDYTKYPRDFDPLNIA